MISFWRSTLATGLSCALLTNAVPVFAQETSASIAENAEQQAGCPHGVRDKAADVTRNRIEIHYPKAARGKRISGDVSVTATIGCDGYVKACEITQTSGYKVLDDAACHDLFAYAVFPPARNEAGAAVEFSWSGTFNYQMR